jgi:hypothetical protein
MEHVKPLLEVQTKRKVVNHLVNVKTIPHTSVLMETVLVPKNFVKYSHLVVMMNGFVQIRLVLKN